MRFIDLEEIKPKVRHLIPALDEAQSEVDQEQDLTKRAELIKKYRPRWVAFRKAFEEYSDDKCWYTESKNPGSDDDIDHFRPKGRLVDDERHGGYYWLAFDWQNFRLSCHHANRPRINPEAGYRGGKADYFPLVNPEARAYSKLDDLDKEEPALLDPTNIVDVSMLIFNMGGEAALEPRFKGNLVAEMRLEKSILHYHLNWPKFREGRLVLYHEIARLVDRGSRYAPSGRAQGSEINEMFRNTLIDLKNILDPRREYSRAARSYVELFSHEWWIRDILLRVV